MGFGGLAVGRARPDLSEWWGAAVESVVWRAMPGSLENPGQSDLRNRSVRRNASAGIGKAGDSGWPKSPRRGTEMGGLEPAGADRAGDASPWLGSGAGEPRGWRPLVPGGREFWSVGISGLAMVL